jgi:hypothetical protein
VTTLFGRAGRIYFCSFEVLFGDLRKKIYTAIFEKILPFSAIKFSNCGHFLSGSGFTIKPGSGFKKLASSLHRK